VASEEDAERAVRAALDLVGAVDGLEAPLTGRDAELRTVRELFHATADRRVPRLVLVSGPAGVGKSRLGWEFDLVRARLAAADGAPDAAAAFTAAIAGLRERSTPYHLAQGLLDHAQFLLSQGEPDAAALAVEEARDIAERLRCQPLLDRAKVSVETAAG
jgi:ATP/maltotriose-dependent transcriptional regulator MalT